MNATDVLTAILHARDKGENPALILDENSPLVDAAREALKPSLPPAAEKQDERASGRVRGLIDRLIESALDSDASGRPDGALAEIALELRADFEKDERARFEAFHAYRQPSKGAAHREALFARRPDDSYLNESVQRHWWTWQNALAQSPADAQDHRNRVNVGANMMDKDGVERDAARYRWLRDENKHFHYTSPPLLQAIKNHGKRTNDLMQLEVPCYHLGPLDEPIWTERGSFDFQANLDAAIDAALAATQPSQEKPR